MTKVTFRYSLGKLFRWLGWHSDWLRPFFWRIARRLAPTDFERAMDQLVIGLSALLISVGQSLADTCLAAGKAMADLAEQLKSDEPELPA